MFILYSFYLTRISFDKAHKSKILTECLKRVYVTFKTGDEVTGPVIAP